MLETLKRDWKGVLIQSVGTALALVLFLIVATFALGNSSAQSVKYQKAIACELAIQPEARSPYTVGECFRLAGLDPPPVLDSP